MKILNNRSEINVIEKSYKYEIKVKGSRFFGFAFPAENEEEIYHKLKRLKKEYYDASHHCYAYKLTDNFKYSDAGEPSGTAGIRILNAIDHYDLVNILIVIVRYFGGTKLGAGNLGRTYYESAIKVLAKADIKKKYLYQRVIIIADYHLVRKVYHIFNNSENRIINTTFTENANFECLVKPDQYIHFLREMKDISGGKIEIKVLDIIYY